MKQVADPADLGHEGGEIEDRNHSDAQLQHLLVVKVTSSANKSRMTGPEMMSSKEAQGEPAAHANDMQSHPRHWSVLYNHTERLFHDAEEAETAEGMFEMLGRETSGTDDAIFYAIAVKVANTRIDMLVSSSGGRDPAQIKGIDVELDEVGAQSALLVILAIDDYAKRCVCSEKLLYDEYDGGALIERTQPAHTTNTSNPTKCASDGCRILATVTPTIVS
ncbi:hypothetical protein SVAN01_06662 [Stagonosporopsis vannaccii]|nr:hypothetical protein SVAN01_06662 [Stagonosporopsis vannaccii]